ncbi:MAG: hypothetical protein ACPL5F_00410 [Moorellaceae bacterium]
MRDIQRRLLRERRALLDQWVHASPRDRAEILVRIMDIDEQIEVGKTKQPRLPKKKVV